MIRRFRLLMQHKGLLRKVYWVARRSDAIHAWFEPAPIPPRPGRTEYHYTYPADGNLHTSVRRYDHGRLVSVEHHYTDRIKVKTISATTGVQSKVVLSPPAEEKMIL